MVIVFVGNCLARSFLPPQYGRSVMLFAPSFSAIRRASLLAVVYSPSWVNRIDASHRFLFALFGGE